jgi:hypothetical protein
MPLHYVDPHNEHGRRYKALESFGRSRPGQFLSRRLLSHRPVVVPRNRRALSTDPGHHDSIAARPRHRHIRTSSSTEPAIGNPKPNTLSDVHGSAWITAGQGSVILLWGTAGAASVELSQIKPIRETVKTTTVNFNRSTGGVGGVDRRWVLLNLASMKETHSPPGFTIDDAKRYTTASEPMTPGNRILRK